MWITFCLDIGRGVYNKSMDKNKISIIVIVIVILAVVFAAVLWVTKGNVSPRLANPSASSTPKSAAPAAAPVVVPVVTTPVPQGALPQQFPSDIPLEAGAQITLNYNAINAAGNFQASREFISKKTVAENYALYQTVLKDNGWNITGTQAGVSAGDLIFATKGSNNLNIRIYTDQSKQVRVSINNEIKK